MSFSNRLPDLALQTILQFISLQEIENLLKVDKKLKRLLHKPKTRFYQSQSYFRNKKLQEGNDDIASRSNISRAKIDWMFIVDKNNNIKILF